MAQEVRRICGTMILYYAEEVYAALTKESDRNLLMKYATGKRVWKQDRKRYERLRKILVDKRREEVIQWNKEREARGQHPYSLPEYDNPLSSK